VTAPPDSPVAAEEGLLRPRQTFPEISQRDDTAYYEMSDCRPKYCDLDHKSH